MRKLVLALIVGTVGLAAHAQNSTQSMFQRSFVGLGLATADHEYQIEGISNVDHDNWKTSFKVFGGWDVDPYWGVEAGYTHFSSSDLRYLQGGMAGSGESDGYGLYAAGKAKFPFHPQWEAFAKLGIAYSKREVESNTGLSFDHDDTGIYAGLGVQWNFHPQWSLTAEYERYGKSKDIGAKADVWTVAARYNF